MKLIKILEESITTQLDSAILTESGGWYKALDNVIRKVDPGKVSRWKTLFKAPTSKEVLERFTTKYGGNNINNLNKITKNTTHTEEILNKVYKQEELTAFEKAVFMEGMAHAMVDNIPLWKHLKDTYVSTPVHQMMMELPPASRGKFKDKHPAYSFYSDKFLDATFDLGIVQGRKFKLRDISFTQKMVDDFSAALPKDRRGIFHYFHHPSMANPATHMHSGWKFHIFGENIADSVELVNLLDPLTKKWRASAKVGGLNIPGRRHGAFGEKAFSEDGVQFGKMGATFYIPVWVLREGKHHQLYNDILDALQGYVPAGPIKGDKHLHGAINYRYDLTGPIDIKKGVDLETNHAMYNANVGGPYKPGTVEDIF